MGLQSNQGQSNSFYGSIATGMATSEVVQLSLDAAISKALQQNLGLFLGQEGTRSARGQRIQEFSRLLPNITSNSSENVAQEDLAARGIKIPGFKQIVGPFSYFDVRAYLSQPIFDLTAINRERSASQNLAAAQYSYQDARNLVVFTAAGAYLQALAAAARAEDAQAQLTTAQALFDKAVDLHKAGISPAIDSLRSQVELQSRQQRLIAATNDAAKNKLVLARIIGLPSGQQFELVDKVPYSAMQAMTLPEALQRAYQSRADLKASMAQVRAAELARKAASAERLPSLGLDTDYGLIGITPSHSHGTFRVAGNLRIPIFQGGRVRGEVLQADALLERRKAEMEDLRGKIDFEIRAAFLDLTAAADQVRVGASSVDLGRQTLGQSRDRFSAGVADNLEVIQAQEAFANADDVYINSVYSYNFAKLSLARAMGIAESEGKRYLEGK